MRILFFSTAFPQPQDPHRAPYNLHRCRALAEVHEVAVISPRRWTERSAAAGRPDGSNATGNVVSVDYPTYVYTPGFLHGLHARFLWWSSRRCAVDLVRRFDPDVVLSYWTFPDGAVALRIARHAGVPAVAMVGGSDVLLSVNDALRSARNQRVLAAADAVIAVSADLRSHVCALGVDESKVHVLPPAVDRERFSPGDRVDARRQLQMPASRPMLLWVGRMVPVKNVATLVDAAAALAREGRDFLLCLVGDGPLQPALRAQAARLGLGDRVRFVGALSDAALPDWYRAADVTVCPSLSEGTPNVLLESIACGTPFVASGVGGIPAIATPGLDTLVRAGDVGSLTAALRAVIDEPPRAVGRAVVPGSWRAVANAIAQVLADTVVHNRGRQRVCGTRLARMGSVLPVQRIYGTGGE
jgi:glycosyltransferase involved in cell wall biosynthesis